MTLEEKIAQEKLQIEENWEKLAYVVTLDNQHLFDTCLQNIKEHEQLVEWLEELKAYRENSNGYNKEDIELNRNAMYNKAIDDFVNVCKEDILCQTFGLHQKNIEKIAEQLKECGNNA